MVEVQLACAVVTLQLWELGWAFSCGGWHWESILRFHGLDLVCEFTFDKCKWASLCLCVWNFRNVLFIILMFCAGRDMCWAYTSALFGFVFVDLDLKLDSRWILFWYDLFLCRRALCHLFWDGPFGVAFGCEAQFGWEIHDMDWGFGGGVCVHAVRSWRLQLLGWCGAIVRRQGYCSQEIEIEVPVLTLCGLGGYNFSDCAAPRLLFTRDWD